MYNLDNKNLKFKYLSNDISINIWSFWNFASMKNLRRNCNPIQWWICQNSHPIKKILSRVVVLIYNQVCC